MKRDTLVLGTSVYQLIPKEIPSTPESVLQKYLDLRDERKKYFSTGTYDSYLAAKEAYIESFRLISFVALVPEHVFPCYETDRANNYCIWIKRLKICARKIAECCYYLNQLVDATAWCNYSIEIHDWHPLIHNTKWVALCVLAKVLIEEKDYETAHKCIQSAKKCTGRRWGVLDGRSRFYRETNDLSKLEAHEQKFIAEKKTVIAETVTLFRLAIQGRELPDGPTALARKDPDAAERLHYTAQEFAEMCDVKLQFIVDIWPSSLAKRILMPNEKIKMFRSWSI